MRTDPKTGIDLSTLTMEELVAALALTIGRVDRLQDRLDRLEARDGTANTDAMGIDPSTAASRVAD